MLAHEKYQFINSVLKYQKIYSLFGILENEIRTRITATLCEYSNSKGYPEWFLVLPYSLKGNAAIQRAIKVNGFKIEGFENYLPFSFWRYILSSNHYTVLWTPVLHSIFPNLEMPKSQITFHSVQLKMQHALEIRNRLAHYNFESSKFISVEQSTLLWLLEAMEVGLAAQSLMNLREQQIEMEIASREVI